MTKNMGTIDKVARTILGVGLLSLLFLLEGAGRWWGLVGFIPLATVAMSWCPLYSIIGIKTCKTTQAAQH